MIKIVRARNLDDNLHEFSIVAWDKGFTYVFPKGRAAFNPFSRSKMLMSKVKPELKPTIDDYINIAKTNLSRFSFSNPIEEDISEKMAVKSEQVILDKAALFDPSRQMSQRLINSNEDIQQVLSDYPELYDQLADGTVDITADGMLELVMAAIGSVDPEGPNKWLLDYIDGNAPEDGEIQEIVFDTNTTDEAGK